MEYIGDVYRPPSEARSLIIQITLGCSHNQCTFCRMYRQAKFKIKTFEEIKEDISDVPYYYDNPDRIFLADGDALIMKQSELLKVLQLLKQRFPTCNRVGIYGSPKAIMTKSVDDLRELKENGLGIVYLGIESGADKVLKMVHKGVNHDKMVEAGLRVKNSGLTLSTTLINGLGGKELSREHALESARIVNEIQPDYIGVLSLMIDPLAPLYEDVKAGRFTPLSPKELLKETRLFLENCQLKDTVFRNNHASNYVALKGNLNADRDRLIAQIDSFMDKVDEIAAHKIQRF